MKFEQQRLYRYHGVYCTLETWLLWRDKERHGCPWCNRPVANTFGSIDRHLRRCPERARLPVVTMAHEQVVK